MRRAVTLLFVLVAVALAAEPEQQAAGLAASTGYVLVPSPIGTVRFLSGNGADGTFFIAPDDTPGSTGNALYHYKGKTKKNLVRDSQLGKWKLPAAPSYWSKVKIENLFGFDPTTQRLVFAAQNPKAVFLDTKDFTYEPSTNAMVYDLTTGTLTEILRPMETGIRLINGGWEKTLFVESVKADNGWIGCSVRATYQEKTNLSRELMAAYTGGQWVEMYDFLARPTGSTNWTTRRACVSGNSFVFSGGSTTPNESIWRLGFPQGELAKILPRPIIEDTFQCASGGVGFGFLDAATAKMNYSFLPNTNWQEQKLFSGASVDGVALSLTDRVKFVDNKTILIATAKGDFIEIANGQAAVAKRAADPPVSATGPGLVEYAEGHILFGVPLGTGNYAVHTVWHPTLATTLFPGKPGSRVSLAGAGSDLFIESTDNKLLIPSLTCGDRTIPIENDKSFVIPSDFTLGTDYRCTLNVQGVPLSFTIQTEKAPLPTLSISSIADSASWLAGALVPRSYDTLYFTSSSRDFGDTADNWLNWNEKLGRVTVEVNGKPVQVGYNSGRDQVNFLLPGSLEEQREASVVVKLDTPLGVAASLPYKIPLTDKKVALFTYGPQLPVAFTVSGALIGPPSSPYAQVLAGQAVVLYGNGCGKPARPFGDREFSTGVPLETFPSVMIDGFPAQVLWAGYTAGFAALCQINVLVPPGLSSGMKYLWFDGNKDLVYLLAVQGAQ